MAILHVKSPNGTQKDIDLDGLVYDVETGSVNGTISVNGSDVAVKGLGSAAYTASTAYATSGHTHSYLPLSGGFVMTGSNIGKTTDDGVIRIIGGTSTSNSYVTVSGKDNAGDGTITLAAKGSSSSSSLILNADGTIKWGGDTVLTEAGYSASGSGYLKLNNGFLIQWGNSSIPSSAKYVDITFPISFTSACRQVFLSDRLGENTTSGASTAFSWLVDSYESTNHKSKVRIGGVNNSDAFSWLAIGK